MIAVAHICESFRAGLLSLICRSRRIAWRPGFLKKARALVIDLDSVQAEPKAARIAWVRPFIVEEHDIMCKVVVEASGDRSMSI